MTLTPPPLWQVLLLESPWPLVAMLGGIGVALWVLGRRQPTRSMQRVGLAASLLASAVLLLAFVVTTDREALIARTHSLFKAVQTRQVDAVRPLVQPDGATLQGPGEEVYVPAGQFFDELAVALNRLKLESYRFEVIEANVVNGNQGLSQVDVRTSVQSSNFGSAPVRTRWQFTWTRSDEGWRLTDLTWLEYPDDSPWAVQPRSGGWR